MDKSQKKQLALTKTKNQLRNALAREQTLRNRLLMERGKKRTLEDTTGGSMSNPTSPNNKKSRRGAEKAAAESLAAFAGNTGPGEDDRIDYESEGGGWVYH